MECDPRGNPKKLNPLKANLVLKAMKGRFSFWGRRRILYYNPKARGMKKIFRIFSVSL